MKLIGMLDSPYVRRAAISLRCLGVEFEHHAVSVFSNFAQFQQINPAVKAPTLVFDDGDILMDSSLIIQYAESLVSDDKTLIPKDAADYKPSLQIISLALVACEKAVQLIYEKNLRPVEKQFAPWQERIVGQLISACKMLEKKCAQHQFCYRPESLNQAFITSAVAWQFMQAMLGELLHADEYPCLTTMMNYAETLPEFSAFPPTGPGVVAPKT